MADLRDARDPFIHAIRDASRQLVREFGFMGSTLANTNYHASSVHAMIEIAENRAVTAADLCVTLNLEKSTVSRMVRKLIEAGEVSGQSNGSDGRETVLSLTDKGNQTLAQINSFADNQVQDAIATLPSSSAKIILSGLQTYATALQGRRLGIPSQPMPDIRIISGYQPGILGHCLRLHMDYYAHAHGLGVQFEHILACGLGDLLSRLNKPMNQVWAAMKGDEILGTIFIDGEDLGEGKAHLRAFIVSNNAKGGGIGRRMLSTAMEFVDEMGFSETHLFTYKSLSSALHLYKAHGFVLAEEWQGTQWGKELVEQRHVRKFRAGEPRP